MPSLLRRHLTCFFCGRKAADVYQPSIRQWQCKTCEAINHLDERGQVIDPPASSSGKKLSMARNVRYAHSVPRAASPELNLSFDGPAQSTLFCRSCINNQQLYTRKLADYYPDGSEDDPKDIERERAFPAWKRALEERYPIVCEACWPRVESTIREKGYAAKVDYLRKTLEQTRAAGPSQRTLYNRKRAWRDIALKAAGAAYWASFVTQIFWHLTGILMSTYPPALLNQSKEDASFTNCIWQLCSHQSFNIGCHDSVTAYLGMALFIGLSTLWWNNKLSTKLHTSGGRLVGLQEHMVTQTFTFGVRALAFKALSEESWLDLPQKVKTAGHVVMLVFLVAMALISRRMVQIDYTPRFSFADSDASGWPPSRPQQQASSQHILDGPSNLHFDDFPISALAPPSESTYPPSPTMTSMTSTTRMTTEVDSDSDCLDYDPLNAMEWTPSQNNTDLRSLQMSNGPSQSRYVGSGPQEHAFGAQASGSWSPFSGRLPSAPRAPAHQLRNPDSVAQYHQRQQEPENPFLRTKPGGAQMLGSGQQDNRTDMQLRPSKWRPREKTMDTGLEAVFESVFSIGDGPVVNSKEVQDPSSHSFDHGLRQDERGGQTGHSGRIAAGIFVGASVLVGVSGAIWKLVD